MRFTSKQILVLTILTVIRMFLVAVIKLYCGNQSDVVAYSVSSVLVPSYKANLQFSTCYSFVLPMSVSSVLPKMYYESQFLNPE